MLLLGAALWLGPVPGALEAADNDFAAPGLVVASHANGQIVNTRTILLQGTASDAGQGSHGISSVNIRGTVAGSTAVGDAIVHWSQSITLSPGPNHISIYAYDNSTAQNYASLTLTINFQPVDAVAPSLSVASHANGAIVHSKTIVVAGTATDAGTGNNGVGTVYLRGALPGATATGGGTANWSREVTLNRGPNYLQVSATDASDVQNERQVNFTINFQPTDPLPPILKITSHTSGQTVSRSPLVISGTATDAGQGDSGIGSVYLRGAIPNANAAGGATVEWSRSVDLHPGANYLNVYAYDQSDVANEALQSLTINLVPDDAQGPTLNVTSHANGETVFTSAIVLSGTATDAGRGDHGISSVYLRGTLPDVGGTGSQEVNWSRNLTLTPGRNYISVYAYDRNQFPNETLVSLVINFQPADTLGPNLVITSHADGQTVTTGTVMLTGTASDAGRGDNGISLVSVRGRIDGATATGGGQVRWSRVVELTPGRNSIFVSAADDSPFPNGTDQSITLILQPPDSTPPSLTITSHTDGQVVFTNYLTLRGTASDGGRGNNGISGVRVNFQPAENGTAQGAGVANWSRTFALNPGRNTIYVSALDGGPFPQESNVTISVTYQPGDLNPPNLTIDQPRNSITVSTPAITVAGTASDAGQGGNGVTGVTVNGLAATGGVASGAAVATWNRTVNLVRGVNVISVVTQDGSPARNSSARSVTVTYEPGDVDPPELGITSHRNRQTVKTPAITLAGVATDAGHGGTGITSVTVNDARAEGDTAAGGATAMWTRTLTLNPGPNVISVVARDGGNNDTAVTLTLDYDPGDSRAPDLVVTSHRKGQIVAVPTILLAGTASDALQGANGVADVSVNSLPATGGTASGAATAQWTRSVSLNPGPNLISVVAHDNSPARNAAAETLTLIYEPLDLTPPELVITSHKNGQTILGSQITLAGTTSDRDLGDNGISSVTVNGVKATGGVAAGAAAASWSRVISLALGKNVISVVASDASARLNSTAVTLTLIYDPLPPAAPTDFCWATEGGGLSAGYAVAMDSEGNTLVTGTFEGSVTLGGANLLSQGLTDIYVAKYDAGGRLLWARQAGGTNADAGLGIAVDSEGACRVTGYFSGAADFGDHHLQTTGSFDMFLVKYNKDGTISWATNTGGGSGVFGRAVSVDPQGNSWVAGGFHYDAFFGDTLFANNEFSDIFVAKYDPAGDLLWAAQLGGEAADLGTGIGCDSSGGCFVTGYFAGDGFFGDLFLTSVGEADMFVAKFDADGNMTWVTQAGEVGETQGTSVSVDLQGNCLVAGYFDLFVTFGDESLFSDGFYDLFLTKYNPNGEVLWARNTENSNAISAAGVATDGHGNAYVTGTFFGPAEFKTVTLTNGYTAQIFVAKYDPDGNSVWAWQAGGTADDVAFAVAANAAGACVIAGTTTGPGVFGSRLLNGGANPAMVVASVGDANAADPIELRIRLVSPEAIEVQFQAGACLAYRLEGSDDLQHWTTIPMPDASGVVVAHLVGINGATSPRYFRVVSP